MTGACAPDQAPSSAGPVLRLGYRELAPADTASLLNAATLVCVVVESGAGLAEVETIAAVDGVDLVLVGSQDLTYALGIPGQADSPAVLEARVGVSAAQ